MADESINPYESPKDFSGTVDQKPKSVVSVRLRNIAALAVAGYIVITAIELGMRWAAITAGPLEPAFWAIGLIGSPIFAASEAFNLRPLERGSFVLRIAATVGVLVAALFIGEVLSEGLGWNQRTYFEDPYWLGRALLLVVTFLALMTIASIAWHQTRNQ